MRSVLGVVALVLGSGLAAEGPRRIDLSPFSAAVDTIPDGWRPLEFPKIPAHTRYTVVEDGGVKVIRAESNASASGLIHPIDVDLDQYPILRWRWKVEQVIERGDVTRKDGDDYAARVYIAFAFEPDKLGFGEAMVYRAARLLYGDLPSRALNYVWASKAEAGTVHESPFTGSSRMVIARSGSAELETWVDEEHDVLADYRRAFPGEDPPRVVGVAVMTDSDNTGERAVAFYGDVSFLREHTPQGN